MKLESRDLGFCYDRETILERVNFTLPSGGFASFVGASGCGKSTLLRILSLLRPPTLGHVEFDGEPSNSLNQTPNFGFVFQKPTLCPWLTALQNVVLPLKLQGTSRTIREQQAHEAIQLVGLSLADARKRPSQLSGGMQMRTSLARAFVSKPSLMLMDEPFAALDEVLRQQLCETTLRLWQQERWSTLFVTHNVAEAVYVSQTIYILSGKPATIAKVVEVPFQERTPALRSDPSYLEFVAETSARLREAVEANSPSAVGDTV